jgi:hypothetical protein
MKARNHERCSIGIYGWLREQKQASRRYAFVPFVSNIELSNQVPACHGASRFRHQVGVAQDTVDREPSRGQVQHGGASRSVGQPGPPHHDALRSLCLVSASWESVGRRDPTARLGGRNPHGSRPPASLPDATNVNASAPHAILPERVLSFPDFFFARLFHACAD